MPTTPAVSYGPTPPRPVTPVTIRQPGPPPRDRPHSTVLRIVRWVDPIADLHGVHPCSRYVELYWLPIIGPSTTWLLRRLAYGLETDPGGLEIDLVEMARSLGLGERMGKNAPFRRAVQRLSTFELARSHGPEAMAVRARIPPLPIRHLTRLPESLQAGHRRWVVEQQLPEPEQMRRRARRLAADLVAAGHGQVEIERRLAHWHFHPAVAFSVARQAVGRDPAQPGSSSCPAGVSPQ